MDVGGFMLEGGGREGCGSILGGEVRVFGDWFERDWDK